MESIVRIVEQSWRDFLIGKGTPFGYVRSAIGKANPWNFWIQCGKRTRQLRKNEVKRCHQQQNIPVTMYGDHILAEVGRYWNVGCLYYIQTQANFQDALLIDANLEYAIRLM
jgi:hypothetical protein